MNVFETIIITISSGLVGGFISYYFSEKTERYKFELLKREQASRVAELFAFWLRCDDEILSKMDTEERINHCEKLNKITWELAIWIPDEKIIKNIMDKLTHKSRRDIKEIILDIREQIQERKNKKFKWQDIVSFK